MGNVGFKEILFVLLVVLILFGAKRIPEVMKAFGKGIKEFKKAARELESSAEDEEPVKKDDKPASPAG